MPGQRSDTRVPLRIKKNKKKKKKRERKKRRGERDRKKKVLDENSGYSRVTL
jgi:hypothetical protein